MKNLLNLESKDLAALHKSLEALSMKLRKEWSKLSQKVFRDTCKTFPKCLPLVFNVGGAQNEKKNVFHIHCFLYKKTFAKTLVFA